ncbi:acyltransferase [uncultured Algibacter sp.]|uniref:acyltransferase n=1 Tax=uncultured Algibacter sp. TaxID=298659 RepID=UPI003217105E
MSSFVYLWKNRAKFSPISIKFYRAWGKRLFSFPQLVKRNFRTLKLIRKGAKISKLAEIGEANITGKLKFLSIGDNTFIGKARFAISTELKIGNNVCINDEVSILTSSHDIFDPKWSNKRAKITIEDYSWVSTGAMILPGVNLGRGCVVGARAVVTKSVKPGEIVVGNPAKPLNKKRLIEFDYNPCEFVAANRAWLIG